VGKEWNLKMADRKLKMGRAENCFSPQAAADLRQRRLSLLKILI